MIKGASLIFLILLPIPLFSQDTLQQREPDEQADKVRIKGCSREYSQQVTYTANDSCLELKKGKLIWPVDSSCFFIVTTRELVFRKPVKSIAPKDSCTYFMRCAAGGEVRSTGEVPGAGKYAIVRHGEYLTVYFGFDSLLVKKGEIVKERQPVGRWSKRIDDRDVRFQVWRKTNKESMEEWLAPNQPNAGIIRNCGLEYKVKSK
jgi:hypothetical protein